MIIAKKQVKLNTDEWSRFEAETMLLADMKAYQIHSGFYFRLLLDGDVQVQWGREKYDWPIGGLCYFPPGVRYAMHAKDAAKTRLITVRLRNKGISPLVSGDMDVIKVLQQLESMVRANGPVLPLRHADRLEARELIDQLLRVHAQQPAYGLMKLKSICLELMCHLASSLDLNEGYRDEQRVIAETVMHMQHQYDQPLKVGDLAERVGYSSSHFHALFKQVTGESVNAYLTRVRIANACRMLLDTADSPALIGQQIGYESTSRFYEAFKQITGESPGQFRKSVAR